MKEFYYQRFLSAFAVLLAALTLTLNASAQGLDRIQRERAKDMLNAVKNEIKDKYYDPAFKGIDLDAKFKDAEGKLDKATSLGQSFGIIAQAVLELNDSHTTFYPPSRNGRVDYGWWMQMIGDKCFVTAVRPKSDAEKKGLKPGDQILSIEGFRPNRKEMWKINYYYGVLSPRRSLTLLVQSPDGKEPREIIIEAKLTPFKSILNIEDLIREFEINQGSGVEHRFVKVGSTIVWDMPSFITEPALIDNIMQGKVSKANNLVLDLRGNGGGYVVTLERLAGYFVDKDTKIADLKGRKEFKPQMAKTKGNDTYKGKIIVLIDSNSGSASEIFARFIQLEKRGVVLGDRSAGAVMMSRGVPMEMGADSLTVYGMNMTMADVIMTDGKSLEHVGVTPDELTLMTGADLAVQSDPVLAYALQLLGEKVSPEDAGKYFPIKWKD